MIRFLLILFALFFLSQVSGLAQEYTFDVSTLSIEDGLEERQVKGYFFDGDGFMWAYSSKYVQPFDAYRFQSFDLPGILDSYTIGQAGYYKDGKAWILYSISGKGTFGLCFVDLHTKELYSKEDILDASIVGDLDELFSYKNLRLNRVKHLGQYENRLYLSSSTDIFSFDFERPVHKISLKDVDRKLDWKIRVNLKDRHGRLWIPLLGKYAIVDLNKTGETSFELHDRKFCDPVSIFYEWNDKVVLSRRHNIDQNGADISLSIIEDEHNELFSYDQSRVVGLVNDHFYFVERDTLKAYNLKTTQTTALPANRGHKHDFSPLTKPQLVSHKGKVIFNTNYGLVFINQKINPFSHYLSDDLMDNSNSVRGIQVHDNRIYAAIEFEGLYATTVGHPNDYELVNNDRASNNNQYLGRDILLDREDNLWIAHSALLSKWNMETKEHQFISDKSQKSNLNLSYGWTMWQDEDDCIWAFYSNYLEVYCPGSKVLTKHYYKDIGLPSEKMNCYEVVRDQKYGKNRRLWLATDEGLFVLDKEKMRIVDRYSQEAIAISRHLPSNTILHLHIDHQNEKWLATDKGLVHISSNDTISVYDKKNGFLSSNLYAVYEDDADRLWISTYLGIVRFDKDTKDVYTYLKDDGIGQEEFNRIAHYRSNDGTLYFGGLNGITSFHPNDISTKETKTSAVQLGSLEVYNTKSSKLISKREEYRTKGELTILPSDQYVKLKAALLNYNLDNDKLYAWRIPGVIDAWTYQKDRNVQLANLPYGTYQLVLKARDENGQWSDTPLQIKMNVIKPIYLRTWFLALAMLLITLSLLAYYRYRLIKLEKDKIKLQSTIDKATAQIQKDKSIIEAQAQELTKLDQLKTRFFANVSHELRTPLSLILGPIKRLKKSNPGNATDQKLLNYIEKNSVQLKELVDEILDLSKLEHGKLELQEEEVNLYDFLNTHVSQFSSLNTIDHAKILIDIPRDERLIVMLDKPKFQKIINNYLSNAIKYTALLGQIKFKAWERNGDLLISVTDTGRGIHPNDLPYIFDRFYQAKHTYDKSSGGTGIGLSLTQELAKLMDGRVWVESDLGKGSTFYAEIPLKIVSRQDVGQSATVAVSAVEISKPQKHTREVTRILIVEDNKELREYYEIILTDYDIVSTENGLEALQYLQSTTQLPDLILSDLMMPIMNGMELLQKLKSNDLWYQIPVVMLTAKNNRDSKIQALRVGVDDYITKPFDDEELLIRIENLLTNARNRKSIDQQVAGAEGTDQSLAYKPTSSQEDLKWLETFESYIIDHISDDRLSIDSLGQEFAMSVSTLRRQIKRLTGLTPSKYLAEHRLNAARQMLESRKYNNISKVARDVGYANESSFARAFKSRYGITPRSLLS